MKRKEKEKRKEKNVQNVQIRGGLFVKFIFFYRETYIMQLLF